MPCLLAPGNECLACLLLEMNALICLFLEMDALLACSQACFLRCCYRSGSPLEGDEFNTVWILDSNQLGFNRAEQYHQFHNGLGECCFPSCIC